MPIKSHNLKKEVRWLNLVEQKILRTKDGVQRSKKLKELSNEIWNQERELINDFNKLKNTFKEQKEEKSKEDNLSKVKEQREKKEQEQRLTRCIIKSLWKIRNTLKWVTFELMNGEKFFFYLLCLKTIFLK